MASVNKNFVVKNGIEVADNVIFATAASGKVGIGSTLPSTTLDIKGQGLRSEDGLFTGILTATSTLYAGAGGTVFNVDVAGEAVAINASSSDFALSVVGTSNTAVNITSGDLVVDRVVSAGASLIGNSVTVNGSQVVSSARELQNIASLDATTTATIEAAISDSPNTFTDLTVTGISTLGTTQISAGIVTSTSGVTTYYGDGQYLTGITSTTVQGGTNINVDGGTGITTVNLDASISITSLEVTGLTTSTDKEIYNQFDITNNGASAYQFAATGIGFTEATDNPTLYLTKGKNYRFSVNASGHPFYIKTVNSTGTGNAYNDGVDNNGAAVGIITFKVPYNAPDVLHYNCSIHAGMHGEIRVGGAGAGIGIGSEGTFIGAGATMIDFKSTSGSAIVVNAPVAGVGTVTITPGVSLGLAIALGG